MALSRPDMPLLELNKATAKVGQWLFKIGYSDIVSYKYTWGGKLVNNEKLRVLLVSAEEGKYAIGQVRAQKQNFAELAACLLYTSPSPRDGLLSRMPSSA